MTWKETEFISLSINAATCLVAPIFHQVSCAELRTAAVGLILGMADDGAPSGSASFLFIARQCFPESQHLLGLRGAVPTMSWLSPRLDPHAAQRSEVMELFTLGPPRQEVTNSHQISLQEEFAQPTWLV